MRHRLIFGGTLLAFLVVPLAAQAQSELRGNNWVTWSESLRLMYVVGWVDGRQRGVFEAVESISPELLLLWDTDPRITTLATPVTVGQMRDGLDDFYSDYRNRLIMLRDALPIVIDQASGRRQWTEDDLVRLRELAARRP